MRSFGIWSWGLRLQGDVMLRNFIGTGFYIGKMSLEESNKMND